MTASYAATDWQIKVLSNDRILLPPTPLKTMSLTNSRIDQSELTVSFFANEDFVQNLDRFVMTSVVEYSSISYPENATFTIRNAHLTNLNFWQEITYDGDNFMIVEISWNFMHQYEYPDITDHGRDERFYSLFYDDKEEFEPNWLQFGF